MKKRIFSMLLALTMLIGIAPTTFAADSSFSDVADSAWYYDAVNWAVENNITGGIGNGLFGPDNICTRAQVVTFLWATAGKPEPVSKYNPFTDVNGTDWYFKAVLWAVHNGITNGKTATTFAPEEACTRAQVVTFLYAAAGKPNVEFSIGSFSDVLPGDWFLEEVQWAVQNNITGGIGGGKFGPNNSCTRAQIALFLYKADQIDPPNEPETPPVPALAITKQPMSQTINQGEKALLSVEVTGGVAPYSYQWLSNNKNISGATAKEYETVTDGSYSCVITDGKGTKITTEAAEITVIEIPVQEPLRIKVQPVGGEIDGSFLELSIAAEGGKKPYTYQWFINGSPISGETTASCYATNEGTYTCRVTDADNESVTSKRAVVTVPVTDFKITYNLHNDDAYLKTLTIDNPNPESYSSTEGLRLQNLSVPGYTFNGWYDGPADGAAMVKEIPAGSTGDIILYAHWTLNQFTVTFDANGGSVSEGSRKVTCTKEIGTLPVPTKDYYEFEGWYTKKDGGDRITEKSAWNDAKDITLYAHWTEKSPSGWVTEDELPAGAKVLDEKWTYTLTHYEESSESEMPGWICYGKSVDWTDWSDWSSWSDTPVTANDYTQVKTETGYLYGYFTCTACGARMHAYGGQCYTWAGGCGSYNTIPNNYQCFFSTIPYDQAQDFHGTGQVYVEVDGYGRGQAIPNPSSPYYNPPRTIYSYCTRSEITTYHYYSEETLESASKPSGDNISNVQHWVKYQAK